MKDREQLGSPSNESNEYGEYKSSFIERFTSLLRESKEEALDDTRAKLWAATSANEKNRLSQRVRSLELEISQLTPPPAPEPEE